MVFPTVLASATVLCGLVAGFLFAFAVIVMPGIASLGDREFIRVFQRIDGVIQRGHPLFGFVWLGSVVALLTVFALGLWRVEGLDRAILVVATGVYVLGVQLPTIAVNIPLNNALQALNVDEADEEACRSQRALFEARWNRWNRFRTVGALLTTMLLVVFLVRASS